MDDHQSAERLLLDYIQHLASDPASAAIDLDVLPQHLQPVADGIRTLGQHLTQQQAQMNAAAYTDTLTGIANRHSFNTTMRSWWDEGIVFALAFIDLDGLKYYNDIHGHAQGDAFINRVCTALQSILAENERLFRIGGDEFVILARNTEQGSLIERLERTRQALVSEYVENDHYPYGFSFGCVTMDPHGTESRSHLLTLADQRMYNYKIEHKYRGAYSVTRRESDYDLDYGITGKLFDILAEAEKDRYIYLCNMKTNLSRWSKNAVTDFGLSGAYMYDAAGEWCAHIHPDDRQAYLDDLEAVFSGKKDRHSMIYRAMDAQGHYVLCYCAGMVEKGVGNEPDIFAGSITRCNYETMNSAWEASPQNWSVVERFTADMPCGFFIYRASGKQEVVYVNHAVLNMYGCENEEQFRELTGNTFTGMVHPDDLERVQKSIKAQIGSADTGIDYVEYRITQRDGSVRWILDYGHYVNSQQYGDVYYVFINIDPSHRLRRMDYANFEYDQTIGVAPKEMNGSILVVDQDPEVRRTLISMLSDRFMTLEAADGLEALDLLNTDSKRIAMVATGLDMPRCNGYELISRIKLDKRYQNIPAIVVTAVDTPDTEKHCLDLGASDYVVIPCSAEVLLKRVQAIMQLHESAAMISAMERDELTGLYTKEVFYYHADRIIRQHPDVKYTITVSDIENFRAINEKYGVITGDKLIRDSARFMPKCIAGYVIGGRLDGDRFAFLRTDTGLTMAEEEALMQRCLEQMPEAPIGKIDFKFGLYRVESGVSVRAMCDRAIHACNRIKGIYNHCVAEYDESMRKELLLHKQIVDSMETALMEHQFQVYFQPKHDLQTDRTGGAEALVRWIHPEMGFMSPGLFIPLFEQNGFIHHLDRYVLTEVCRIMSDWRAAGMELVPVSVNLSQRDFEIRDLAEKIIGIVDAYQLPHAMLHFELTESAFANHADQVDAALRALSRAGFVIELDDFGTGYSSLSALNKLPIDVLKLDMSLVREDNPDTGRSTLEFAVQLAKMIGMKVVAEGVETEDQVGRLQALGVEYVQGYFYAKPLPVKQFVAYTEQERLAALQRDFVSVSGILNQEAFNRLQKAYEASNKPYALLLLDIDVQNVDEGTPSRKELMDTVAALIRNSIRSVDLPFYLGHGDFAMIMMEMDSSLQETVSRKINALNEQLMQPGQSTPRIRLHTGVSFSDRCDDKTVFDAAYTALREAVSHDTTVWMYQ